MESNPLYFRDSVKFLALSRNLHPAAIHFIFLQHHLGTTFSENTTGSIERQIHRKDGSFH
jgi:hypothetical protein